MVTTRNKYTFLGVTLTYRGRASIGFYIFMSALALLWHIGLGLVVGFPLMLALPLFGVSAPFLPCWAVGFLTSLVVAIAKSK